MNKKTTFYKTDSAYNIISTYLGLYEVLEDNNISKSTFYAAKNKGKMIKDHFYFNSLEEVEEARKQKILELEEELEKIKP